MAETAGYTTIHSEPKWNTSPTQLPLIQPKYVDRLYKAIQQKEAD